MGTSTPSQFAKKMHRVANDVESLPRRTVRNGARVIRRNVDRQLDQVAPSRRLNVGKNGTRIGVRDKVVGPAAIQVSMFGPAHLIERDTERHRIPRSTGKGAKRRGDKQPLHIPGVGFRARAEHPGTKGKYPWKKGLAAAVPQVKVAAASEFSATVKKALR